MRRILGCLALCALTVGLGACGERPQEGAGRQIRGSEPAWQGPATAFTVPGWTVGDRNSWQAQLQTRAQAQNENVRLGAGH